MKVYRVEINLAGNEWGNELMRQVADEYAASATQRPLIVHVNEHAGWWLSFLYGAPGIEDGTTCGTANDKAELRPDVVRFGKRITEEEHLLHVRRKEHLLPA